MFGLLESPTMKSPVSFAHISSRRRVVGSGLIALDVLLNEHKSTVSSALGGSAGNVLAILAHMGWNSVPVAKVGTDSAAKRIRDEFEALNADVQFLVEEGHFCTPVVFQLPGDAEKTHRFTFACPHCGRKRHFSYALDDYLGAPVLSAIESSDVYYFDRVTPLSLRLAEDYRARGAMVVFEPSTIGSDHASFGRALKAAHMIKYADDRIEDLRTFDLSSVAIEIQTSGKDGLKFRSPSSGDNWVYLAAYRAQHVADTSGSGDWCTAGMLYSLFSDRDAGSTGDLTNHDLSKALRFGQALAALNCSYAGARGLAQQQGLDVILEMASAVQGMTKVHFWRAERQLRMDTSIEKHHLAIEDRTYQRLCCEGLAF